MHFDASNAELSVFTFKEGLLSRVAHDLRLRARRFEMDVNEEAGTVTVRVDPAALEVVCAMRAGQEAPEALSPSDCEEIREKLRGKVLEVDRYPEVRFEGRLLEGGKVRGKLFLHGTQRELEALVREEAGKRLCEVRLDQRCFGIEPYHALLGALRVSPTVLVRISVAET